MFSWVATFLKKFLSIGPISGDLGFNIKPEINNEVKLADNIDNKLIEIHDNSKNLYYQGMSYSDIKQLIIDEQNAADKRLIALLDSSLSIDEKLKIRSDYDYVYTYNEAVKISAKRKDDNIDKLLSKTLKDRIQSEEDLNTLVYNEAIMTIGKLADVQLKLLGMFIYIANFVKTAQDLDAIEAEAEYFLKTIKITEFGQIDIEHLLYTGCADRTPLARNFIEILKVKYKDNAQIQSLKELSAYPSLKKIQDLWEVKHLKYITLTSVGKVIAINYYQEILNTTVSNRNDIFKRNKIED